MLNLRLRVGVGVGQTLPIPALTPTPGKRSTPIGSNPGLDSDSAALIRIIAQLKSGISAIVTRADRLTRFSFLDMGVETGAKRRTV